MKLKKYNDFLILEKFDDNIIDELKRLGVTDEDEINQHLYHAHRGYLADYLKEKGKKFTFGMLNALFKDARDAKKRTGLGVGIMRAVHGLLPITLAPFFPVFATVGLILGTSRAFNKVLTPILSEPGATSTYPDFLKKMIDSTMRFVEGDLAVPKDRFTRAFVVSDRIVDFIKPEVLSDFSIFLSEKMSQMDPDEEVPDHYIENELKQYLNANFDITPPIPLKKDSEPITDTQQTTEI